MANGSGASQRWVAGIRTAGSRRVSVGLFVAVIAVLGTRAGAWTASLDDFSTASGLAIDANGDALAAAAKHDPAGGAHFAVVKLSGADGRLLWQYSIADSGIASAIAADSADDAVAAGYRQLSPPNVELLVVKLAAGTGTELWRYTLPDAAAEAVVTAPGGDVIVAGNAVVARLRGSDGAELWRFDDLTASAVTIDAAGDVVAGGTTVTPAPSTYIDFSVVKLDGASGALLWRHEVNGTANYYDRANAVVTDAAGGVVAAGELQNVLPGQLAPLVIKLNGTDGAEEWRYELSGGVFRDVRLDASGNAFAAGTTSDGSAQFLTVAALAAASGAEMWRADVSSIPGGTINSGEAMVLDPAGDVVAAGATQAIAGGGSDIAVLKLGSDGTQHWRGALSGHRDVYATEGASDVGLDAAGNVIVAGSTDFGLTVAKLGERVSGKRIAVEDAASAPRKELSVRSQDPALFASVPGSGGDPTLHGGSLELRNPTTGESALFDLPAVNWHVRGGPTHARGYSYRDPDSSSGPCTKVDLRGNGSLKAICRGPQMTFTLNEASQGSLIAHLRIGGQNLCMRFGGTLLHDSGVTDGEPGVFGARNAATSAVCP